MLDPDRVEAAKRSNAPGRRKRRKEKVEAPGIPEGYGVDRTRTTPASPVGRRRASLTV